MNKWRSPSAEKIFGKRHLIETRSAGTSAKAKRHVSENDLKWADVVIVMETKHRQRLNASYPHAMRHLDIHVLEIEDNYQYMDPELVEELNQAVDPILDTYFE